MKEFIVNADLYVEDDDTDGALATAQTILKDAGGTDLLAEQGCTFGFALGDVRGSDEPPAATGMGYQMFALIDKRGYDLPSAYGPFLTEDAAEKAAPDLIEAVPDEDGELPDDVFVVRLINPDPYLPGDIVTILMRHGL